MFQKSCSEIWNIITKCDRFATVQPLCIWRSESSRSACFHYSAVKCNKTKSRKENFSWYWQFEEIGLGKVVGILWRLWRSFRGTDSQVGAGCSQVNSSVASHFDFDYCREGITHGLNENHKSAFDLIYWWYDCILEVWTSPLKVRVWKLINYQPKWSNIHFISHFIRKLKESVF